MRLTAPLLVANLRLNLHCKATQNITALAPGFLRSDHTASYPQLSCNVDSFIRIEKPQDLRTQYHEPSRPYWSYACHDVSHETKMQAQREDEDYIQENLHLSK